jgi:hypothetical protein
MYGLDLADLLTLVQTIAIIAALVIALYFSSRQAHAMTQDLEMRVLTDIDDRFHGLAEILIAHPELVRTIARAEENVGPELPTYYYVMMFMAHIVHARQRGLLSDSSWEGWHEWMRNAFRLGNLATAWKKSEMGRWFDPGFQRFVETDLLLYAPPAK